MNTHSINLTDGPITGRLVSFSIPILLSNLFQQLYNSIDSMVLGSFAGSMALAAVGGTGALINLLIGFFLGIATGTGVLYAMHYGAGDYKGLKKIIDSAMCLSVAAALLITFFGIYFSGALLRFMHTPDEVFAPSRQYLVIFLSGTVANLIYNVGSGMIRAEGDSLRPLIYLVIGGVLNLVLDLLLVAVFGMGVAGAAWATVAAQAVTAVLVVCRLTKLNSEYALNIFHIRPDALATWDIVRISVPCGLQSSMFNISNLLVQIKVNLFGATAMAGVAAFDKIDAFNYMPMNALALSVSTYVGQNIGAGKYERVRPGVRISMLMCIGVSVVIGLISFSLYDPLIHLFTDDVQAIDFGRRMMHFIIPFSWTFSVTDILGGVVRGSGQAAEVTVITAICICVFRILWLQIMLHFIWDIRIVFVCYPLSWTLCNIVMTWYYYRRSTISKSLKALNA